ncbi:unnamed protein product [Knipowitschia caucasica]
MNYDERVGLLENWSLFQRKQLFVLCMCVLPSGYTVFSVIFLLATPAHHCDLSPSTNLSQEWIEAISPAQSEHGALLQVGRRVCRGSSLGHVENASAHGLHPADNTTTSELPSLGCHGWNFSQQYFTSTVVTEFALVCGDQWKRDLSSMVFFFGGMCGCFVSGQLADRVGRKPVLFASLLLLSVFSWGLTFAPSWPVFTALFFMVGCGQATTYIIVFVLGSELLTGKMRVLFSTLGLPFSFTFGMMLLPYAAYLLSSWRHLAVTIAAVSSVACLPFWWLVPESPRWLLSQGHKQEAERILQMAASPNQLQAPIRIFYPEQAENRFRTDKLGESGTFLDLLKARNVRNIIVKLWICWFAIHVSYYGMAFITSSLFGNPFLNYFLVSVIELPAYVCSWLAATRCPRRKIFIMFGALGSTGLLLTSLTTDIWPTVTLVLVMLGKFGVLAAISCMYIHTGELFPTVIRNTAMSSCGMLGRVGAALSPYLQHLETFREPLPDSIEQMTKPQRFSLIFSDCFSVRENTDKKAITVSPVSPVAEVLCSTPL